MSSQELSLSAELVRLTRVASEACDLSTLVSARHQLRAAVRRALVSQQWSHLDEAQSELAASPPLAARFHESLHHALESPEFTTQGTTPHWHGLVLAIPVTLTSREGTLVSLPPPLARAVRESLQARLPDGTGIRLLSRLIPQLVAHSMRTQSLYELIEELASGESAATPLSGVQPTNDFVPQGRSLGRHYLFALAFTAHPEQFALEMPRELRTEPELGKWAAAQTEMINNDFAERGWQLLARMSAPQRLSEMLSLPPVLSDVRELDAFLDHVASQHEIPVPMLRADLRTGHQEEPGLRIVLSDRRLGGAELAHGFYRLAALGAEAGAYRVAVRLASAGAELAATEETLRRAVDRAITLAPPAPTAATATPDNVPAWRLGTKSLWSRFSRSSKHPT